MGGEGGITVTDEGEDGRFVALGLFGRTFFLAIIIVTTTDDFSFSLCGILSSSRSGHGEPLV